MTNQDMEMKELITQLRGTVNAYREKRKEIERMSTEEFMELYRRARWLRSDNKFTIDVETVAASNNYFEEGDFSDIWQIGITNMRDGSTRVWTIRPHKKHYYSKPFWKWYEFKEWGRNAKWKVRNKPELPEVYEEIIEFIGLGRFPDLGLLIAHNASFDRSAWEQTLELYGLDITNHDWFCTKEAYKKAFPNEPSRLKDLVNKHTDSEYVEELMHDAGKDSYALYEVLESLESEYRKRKR